MAGWLTPLRLAGLTLLAGLMLGLALGQATAVPEPVRRWPDDRLPETRARGLLEWHARAATAAWETAHVVDSLRRVLPGERGRYVHIGRGVPRPIADAVTALGSSQASAAMQFAAVVDTAPVAPDLDRGIWRGVRVTHAFPRTEGEPCLIIVRVGVDALQSDFRPGNLHATFGDRIPGPCAFAGAFGVPGPHIGDWLVMTNGRFVQDADWTAPQVAWGADESYSLWDLRWDIRNATGIAYLGCIRGRANACATWLAMEAGDIWAPRLPSSQRAEMLAAIGPTVTGRVALRRNYWNAHPFGDRFLADLIAMRGPDAFRAFWTSDREVAAAFEGAYGMTIGAWAAGWVREIGMSPPRELRPTRRAVPGALVLMLGFVGLALAYVSRRTVSA